MADEDDCRKVRQQVCVVSLQGCSMKQHLLCQTSFCCNTSRISMIENHSSGNYVPMSGRKNIESNILRVFSYPRGVFDLKFDGFHKWKYFFVLFLHNSVTNKAVKELFACIWPIIKCKLMKEQQVLVSWFVFSVQAGSIVDLSKWNPVVFRSAGGRRRATERQETLSRIMWLQLCKTRLEKSLCIIIRLSTQSKAKSFWFNWSLFLLEFQMQVRTFFKICLLKCSLFNSRLHQGYMFTSGPSVCCSLRSEVPLC